MNARGLICDERHHFTLAEVVLPDLTPEAVVVRALTTGVSIGTEFALIRNKISYGPYPLCTGYQAVGVVEAVGERVEGLRAGDRVYYRTSPGMRLPDGRRVTSCHGAHCSHAVLSTAGGQGPALLPEGVAPDVACLFVMPAVGLFGVDMANPRLGATVVVYGVGLIGLGVVAACAHRGCVVIAVDIDEKRLRCARSLGADYVIDGAARNVAEEVKRIAPEGADMVFEATGSPACLDAAIALCRTDGAFVWQGNYGAAPISFHFLPPHGRRLRMFFPCGDGGAPCRRAVLKNMAMGALPWERVITHRVAAAEAPALFDRINRGQAPDVLGAVIHWSDER